MLTVNWIVDSSPVTCQNWDSILDAIDLIRLGGPSQECYVRHNYVLI
jgi:hypothetical protein